MEKFEVRFIIEILGKPKENLVDTLNKIFDKLSNEKEIKILEKEIYEPIEVKESKDLFTTFAEAHAEFESISSLFGFILMYMPSNLEVISPEKIEFDSTNFNEFISKLIIKLHDYDAITKKALIESEILKEQLKKKD